MRSSRLHRRGPKPVRSEPRRSEGSVSADTPRHRNERLRAFIPGSAPLLWHARAEAGVVALTFDDGPDPDGTPAVLDALAAFDATATFFVVGERAVRHPSLVRRIVSGGHEVALHADRHERLDRVAVGPLTRRLTDARARLEDQTGRPVRHHRPPFGRLSWRGLQAARRAGLRVVLWSHNPCDWEPAVQDELERRLRDCLVPGAIVLLHDGSDAFDGQGRATASAMKRALPSVVERSLRPVPCTAL
jgi:peptidoglycan/xylan/chitin deacetylase (PgdA/CDA1 family)